MTRLKNVTYAALIPGLALAIGLIAWQGCDPLASVLAVAGSSLFLLGLYQFVPLLLATLSWRRLLGPAASQDLPRLIAATWIGISVNWLLPVAQVGGEMVRARLLILNGADGAAVGASLVAEKMIQGAVQVGISLLGVGLLFTVAGTHVLAYWTAGFALVLSACLYGFFRVQRAVPLGRLTGLLQRVMPQSRLRTALPDGRPFDAALGALYQRRGQLALAVLWRAAERLARVGEVWLALWLLGNPVSLVDALILESLTQAVRAAAFVVPAGLGVQEGGLVLVGGALGLAPDVSLALSLAKRFRELVVGLPGLMAWQLHERRHRANAIKGPSSTRTERP